MKTDRQLIEQLLELQEHPEQVTDEQLQQSLDDPQMRELVEQMAFAKRTFKNEELQTVEPDVEGEWEKFAADHYGEEDGEGAGFTLFTHHSSLQKMAASFIGVLLVSGMAFAAIHIVRMVNSQKAETVQVEQPRQRLFRSNSPRHISHLLHYLPTPLRPTRRLPWNPSYSTTCRWRRC